jgi:hypothetical protein
VQGEIEDKIYDVLEHGRPDAIPRMGTAYCAAQLLEYQREISMTTWVNLLDGPCGCGAFVPKAWVN